MCRAADGGTLFSHGEHGSEHTRLSAFASAIRGEEPTLADFAAGLRVQRVVEHFHQAAS
ncbi:hypothetical protein ABT294_03165 [Nonomuraea sp. NPDC000554]|uniref:hypothetical protein n=1 Tax=Nonomuraea sp. NPDC000554 TaxID=3154259 RepID=UPI003325EA06